MIIIYIGVGPAAAALAVVLGVWMSFSWFGIAVLAFVAGSGALLVTAVGVLAVEKFKGRPNDSQEQMRTTVRRTRQ